MYKEAVSKYKVKWAKQERVDKRVLNEWERTVHSCIDSKIESLRKKYVNKERNTFLKGTAI